MLELYIDQINDKKINKHRANGVNYHDLFIYIANSIYTRVQKLQSPLKTGDYINSIEIAI